MQEKLYYPYIVGSRTHVLSIGVTSNLERRMHEHRSGEGAVFTARYGCDRLVWFERYPDPILAIMREKELKGWMRARKIVWIEEEKCDVGGVKCDLGRGDCAGRRLKDNSRSFASLRMTNLSDV